MRTVSRIAAILLSVFLIWNIYLYLTNRDTTELARYGSIRDIISCDGYLIKSETLVASPADGVLQPYIPDCKRAGKDMTVAAILSGEADEASRKQLTVIKSRITSLEDAMKNKGFEDDAISIDGAINENIKQIIKSSASGKMTKVEDYKNKIILLSDKKSASGGRGDEILAKLREDQKTLESKLGNLINEVAAPCSGVFSARLDGLEETLTPDSIQGLTVSELDSFKKVKAQTQSKVQRGENVFKIIDNFNWYLAVVLSDEQTDGMQIGDIVRISFRDADGEVANAAISNIGDDENGKRVVAFALNRDIQGVLGRRRVSIDIIRRTYEGFKLPTAALAYENGTTGVYVINGAAKVFKPCEVTFHNEEYMIIKEDNSREDALLLYDTVVISGEQSY